MSLSQSTPGPWDTFAGIVFTDIGYLCAVADGAYSFEENLANAKLIAAAPQMLAALQEIRSAIIGRKRYKDFLPQINEALQRAGEIE